MASDSIASIRRCSLESVCAPTDSKNWLGRSTSGSVLSRPSSKAAFLEPFCIANLDPAVFRHIATDMHPRCVCHGANDAPSEKHPATKRLAREKLMLQRKERQLTRSSREVFATAFQAAFFPCGSYSQNTLKPSCSSATLENPRSEAAAAMPPN